LSGGASSPETASADVAVRDMLNIGMGLHRQGNTQAADAIYREVLARDPGNAAAGHLLGVLAVQGGRFQEAVERISAAMARQPDVAEMHVNRGAALVGLEAFEAALADYDRALALRPDLQQAHHQRADALQALGRLEEAFAAYEAAVGLNPSVAVAWFNRGGVLRQLRRIGEAIESYDRAIALKPDFAMAHHNRAICLMTAGRLTEGLAEYEWRKRCPDAEQGRDYAQPAWTGAQDLAGRTLYIWPELFLGDMVQFCRYARLAEARGARVVMSAPRALHGLLRTLSPTIELGDPQAPPAAFDYHCALMSLPLAFGAGAHPPPAEPAYLAAEPDRVARWRERLGTGGFRIGVCWQGSTAAYSRPMQRSFPLRALAGIARLPGVRLISLQKHDGLDQLGDLPPGMVVETLGEDFDAGADAFLDTAAVIANCDLVVSADTATAHVAGALGARTWVPLPFTPDWRWGLEGSTSPWYPSLHLFRQSAQGDWADPLSDMESELSAWPSRRGGGNA
jgi:tetratricopeptide (TPR) repeat protein